MKLQSDIEAYTADRRHAGHAVGNQDLDTKINQCDSAIHALFESVFCMRHLCTYILCMLSDTACTKSLGKHVNI